MMWVDTSTREGKKPQAGDRILCHPTIDRYTTASPLPIFILLERKRRHVGAENMYRYSTIHVFGLTFWQIQPINLCVDITPEASVRSDHNDTQSRIHDQKIFRVVSSFPGGSEAEHAGHDMEIIQAMTAMS